MNYQRIRQPFPGQRLLSFLMVLFVLTLGIGIGTLITHRSGAFGPGDSQLKIQTDSKPLVGGAALSLSQAFEEVSKRVEPAVVNINTEEVVRVSGRGNAPRSGEEDPFGGLLPFFNAPQGQYKRASLGSGILVDPKGYILTNNHVVEGAMKIKVGLFDGEEYTARLVAGDQLSDIAVIKIDTNKDLPYAKIGDAKALKVGDWVLAIGSPFGLKKTVTAGIISATGRVFPDANGADPLAMLFNDYLQTDAAINPGNSGGPLVSMNGEVVGINTFIQTSSRSNAGVGFAVPSHIFVGVYNQIIEKGKVSRGWLGVNMNILPNAPSFTPAMARYFGVKTNKGVLITGLSDDAGKPSNMGPAGSAGLKAEDVIVEFDGKKIQDAQDFRLAVASTPPGRKVHLNAVRHGVEKVFEVTVGERKIEERQQKTGSFRFEEKEEQPRPEIGLEFDDAPQRVLRELNESGGAIVTAVKPGSLAEDAGLFGQNQQFADIIVEGNGKKILTGQDLVNTVKGLKSGDAVVLKFYRVSGGQSSVYYTSIVKP